MGFGMGFGVTFGVSMASLIEHAGRDIFVVGALGSSYILEIVVEWLYGLGSICHNNSASSTT